MCCATVARAQIPYWTEIVPLVSCSCVANSVALPELLPPSRLDLLRERLAVKSLVLDAAFLFVLVHVILHRL